MIVAAAIKMDGNVYGLPAPARHHDIIRHLASLGYDTPIKEEQGFIDDTFGFMDRQQAAASAYTAGQIENPKDKLFTEDLW